MAQDDDDLSVRLREGYAIPDDGDGLIPADGWVWADPNDVNNYKVRQVPPPPSPAANHEHYRPQTVEWQRDNEVGASALPRREHAEIVQALQEERRLRFRSLRFKVEHCERKNDVFKVVVEPVDEKGSLDEALEGAVAAWSTPYKGHADILSVIPEDNLLTLRHATSNPPSEGGIIVVRVPDFIRHLLVLWQDESVAASCFAWFDRLCSTEAETDPTRKLSVPDFPRALRRRQQDAFLLYPHRRSFLVGPPGTGKTATLASILAAHLTQFPDRRVLLLATTNTAVDQALIATDTTLETLARSRPDADDARRRCKRVGLHFIASKYVDRQHLLSARREPIAELTALEASRPESADDDRVAEWRDAIESIRRRIRERTYEELSGASLHAMTTTRATFDFEVLRKFSYDLAVFDEASQVGLAHALMLSQLAEHIMFVGDPKQLAPIVQSDDPDAKKWMGRSIFEEHAPTDGPAVCVLNEQNRMAEDICRVVSAFYEGSLRVATDARTDPRWNVERQLHPLPEIGDRAVYIRTIHQEGTFANPGWYRLDSAKFICQMVLCLVRNLPPEDILVVTPFRAQRFRIKQGLRELGLGDVSVSTVHRAQGGERHTVLFDPVKGDLPWLQSREGARLINVAISRAKARLIITLSRGDKQNPYLQLIAHFADNTELGDAPF